MGLPLALWSFAAGAVWGGIAYALGAGAIGPPIWAGILASPFIGLVVGLLIQPRFVASSGVWRVVWALVGLYLGAVLFGIAIGVADEISRQSADHVAGAALIEAVLAVLWGVTVTGFVLVLAPLAYLTHWFLEWRLE